MRKTHREGELRNNAGLRERISGMTDR
jgi:hypothetical protein